MKYLMLLVLPALLLISCDCEDDIQTIKGDYTLSSYSMDCGDDATTNLAWRGNEIAEEELSVTGTLDIKLISIFKQKLNFHNNDSSEIISKEFVGALSKTEKENDWVAEYSEKPFKDEDCDIANITIDGDTLIWKFTDDEGCTIIMIWEKDE